MDRRRGNIVVSRRAVLEETRAEQRSGLIQSLHEGQVIDGVVKNINDYAAFVDMGGIAGVLHVTDMHNRRVGQQSEWSHLGDPVKVESEEGRVENECVITCVVRGSEYNSKNK